MESSKWEIYFKNWFHLNKLNPFKIHVPYFVSSDVTNLQ